MDDKQPFEFDEKTGTIKYEGKVYVGCRPQPPGEDIIEWLERDLKRSGFNRDQSTEICVAALNRAFGVA